METKDTGKKIASSYFLDRIGSRLRETYGAPETPAEMPEHVLELLKKLQQATNSAR